MKITISEMKNLLEVINSRLGEVEYRITELEDKKTISTQRKNGKENRQEK